MALQTHDAPAAADGGPGRWLPFDVRGPLPSGTTVLEASAGTGKTFALAALTARFVAEADVPLRSLLLVTFGRMATTELRTRVRERLTSLLAALTSGNPATDDEVAALLCAVDDAERSRRRARVDAALRDIDEATIATTHEFCLQMLESLGVLGDAEPQAHFVEQVDDLVDEVASDLYLRRYAPEGRPPFTLPEAQTLGRRACASVTARLVPRPDEDGPAAPPGRGGWAADAAAERVSFAEAVRAEVERRMRAARLFTYDDMLTRLAASLHDPDRGPAAVARLQARYAVVLVDEFQDTDPVQWDILRTAFAGHARMVLIGDPKQAIYGFRGADVQCYLDARETPGTTVSTLPTNYRSDPGLVEALGTLLGGASLGERGIVVDPVSAARAGSRLTGPDAASAPLRLRVWPSEPGEDKPVRVREVRSRVRDDLVADVVRLLGGDGRGPGEERVRLDRRDGRGPQPVGPGDVAVLVRTNEAAEDVRTRLVGAGVPTVVHAARSVFASEAAQDWVTLLAALDATRQATVRAATLTAFFGWSVADLVRASEAGASDGADGPGGTHDRGAGVDRLVDVTQQLRAWRRLLASRGVAALVETATRENRVAERLLATEGGARRLTDLRHLAEVLHDAAVVRQLGPGALLDWLRDRVVEARRDKGAEGSRRLESDGSQVTVVTIHRSKGLEYPVVYLPDAYDRWVPDDDGGTLLLHPETEGDGPTPALDLDVGGKRSPGRPTRFRRYQAEQASEDLRLLYVALTRAQCQVVTWWAPTRNTPCSALQRLLRREVAVGGGPGGAPAAAYPLTLGDPTHGRDLGPHVRLETFDPAPLTEQGRYGRSEPEEGALGVRTFDRTLDLAWRRTSYSALTAAAHGLDLSAPGVSSEPEPGREDDETPTEGELDAEAERDAELEAVRSEGAAHADAEDLPAEDPWDAVSPMAGLPSGADFGTAVHAVLEEVDPGSEDLAAAVRSVCASVLTRTPSSGMTLDALADGLLPAFTTPLGRLVDDRTLADVALRDRLAELAFELPLAGGDEPTGAELRLGDLAPLLRRHIAPGEPLGSYADRLTAPVLAEQPLRGYLTGSIDAVLRVTGADQTPRYLVVDYKTNWLGPFDGRPLTLRAYAPQALATAMLGAHYPLQALLYAVAVHRMLRWRQPGYDPEVHLGGVLYLFVRGMAGPGTPRTGEGVAGVFEWRPPAALVTELSDLLAGVAR
ncbi:exodeoxyribonuclease V beta subunit [Microlunatus sagamiharensis]|uniref:RecBCD enzyme subunit RecB n=1 Tax=Microlunatus sagamiharensis TaxID=546874 RepID=A0A1H2MC58_9ACTN|nr:UvrD-helicase domain-containing protein [Microlunatus sagamiharensis]SDU90712.1 exodeoxyribonuclease V beta subunit [Microlunatus sagamiharensis]